MTRSQCLYSQFIPSKLLYMNSTTPLIFRASAAQRAVAVVLSLGCLLVAGPGASLTIQNIPKIYYQLKLAQSQAEPTALIWLSLALACAALLAAGAVLLLAVIALMLIEGTQVLVDDIGITVECTLLPEFIGRRFGTGRVSWKNVAKIERRKMCFVLEGVMAEPNKSKNVETIRFLLVDELERLIFIIIERSPNLKLNS